MQAPAESVVRSRTHEVKISLHLTPSAELCSLYSKNARVDKDRKECVRVGRQRTACRKDGAPDVKDNQITEHLSLSLSPPLQITRDTRVKKERSNEGHISCYIEAMPIQHYHIITT